MKMTVTSTDLSVTSTNLSVTSTNLSLISTNLLLISTNLLLTSTNLSLRAQRGNLTPAHCLRLSRCSAQDGLVIGRHRRAMIVGTDCLVFFSLA
jgi:hypothetical protein